MSSTDAPPPNRSGTTIPQDLPGPEGREGVHPPVQERSRKTLERIVRAALELMAERGVEGTSVKEIVDRAGSSVGSFYARFDGKDDLVRYLEEHVWTRARERWDEGIREGAWTGADLATFVRGVVELLFRIEGADAGRRRALRAGGGGSAAPAGAEAFRRHIAEDVRSLLLSRREEIGHPDPERAMEVLLAVLIGAVREMDGEGPHDGSAAAAGGGEDGRAVAAPRAWAVGELTRMALAYLGTTAGDPLSQADEAEQPTDGAGAADQEEEVVASEEEDPAERGGMDFFDVWE